MAEGYSCGNETCVLCPAGYQALCERNHICTLTCSRGTHDEDASVRQTLIAMILKDETPSEYDGIYRIFQPSQSTDPNFQRIPQLGNIPHNTNKNGVVTKNVCANPLPAAPLSDRLQREKQKKQAVVQRNLDAFYKLFHCT